MQTGVKSFGMREQHGPRVADPVVEVDPPLRRVGIEVRCGFAQRQTHRRTPLVVDESGHPTCAASQHPTATPERSPFFLDPSGSRSEAVAGPAAALRRLHSTARGATMSDATERFFEELSDRGREPAWRVSPAGCDSTSSTAANGTLARDHRRRRHHGVARHGRG